MQKVVMIGECMLELTQKSEGHLSSSYAGDTYNTAVYLKRAFPKVEVGFMTCLGKDSISQDMRREFEAESLNTDLAFTHDDLHPGTYLVQTDEQGERTFVYWRGQSAARQMMQHISEFVVGQLKQQDILFFSGITLAILEECDRQVFFSLIEKARLGGATIAFDPNYRARLWSSPQEARNAFGRAFSLTDIALPGIDDFVDLYGFNTPEQVLTYFESFDLIELVLKNGANEIIIVSESEEAAQVAVKPSNNVVDTTSAGDAFNGIYLGARLNGAATTKAADMASKGAKCVIEHAGAIVPKPAFATFLEDNQLGVR